MLDAFRILSAFFGRARLNSDDVKIIFLVRDERAKYLLETAIKADPEIVQVVRDITTDPLHNGKQPDLCDFRYHGLHILVKEAHRGS